nr:DUF169 domain-containing protein [Moorella humiferrea]
MQVELTGSTCATAITIPLATGKINLSLIDPSSRKLVPEFKAEDLIFTVPYFRLHLLVESAQIKDGPHRLSIKNADAIYPRRFFTLIIALTSRRANLLDKLQWGFAINFLEVL